MHVFNLYSIIHIIKCLAIIGLPIPIIVVSAAVSHEHYGINDKYTKNSCVCITINLLNTQVLDFSRKWCYLGIHWSHVTDHTGNSTLDTYVYDLWAFYNCR